MIKQALGGGPAWLGAAIFSISARQRSKTLPRKRHILAQISAERIYNALILVPFFALVSIHAQSFSLANFSPFVESTWRLRWGLKTSSKGNQKLHTTWINHSWNRLWRKRFWAGHRSLKSCRIHLVSSWRSFWMLWSTREYSRVSQ